MEKLTKKDFVQELQYSQGYFITSIWNKSVEEVEAAIDKVVNVQDILNNAIYRASYTARFNSLVAVQDNGETSYRYFDYYNQFFKHNGFLIHEVTYEDNSNCIMINY